MIHDQILYENEYALDATIEQSSEYFLVTFWWYGNRKNNHGIRWGYMYVFCRDESPPKMGRMSIIDGVVHWISLDGKTSGQALLWE